MTTIINAKVILYDSGSVDIDALIGEQDGELFRRLGRGKYIHSGSGFVYKLKEGVDLWLWNR